MAGTNHRPNIILMGDMTSVIYTQDCLIIKDLEYSEALKIGFYNWENQDRLANFREIFDLIILEDGNLFLIHMITKIIAGENRIEELMEYLNKSIFQLIYYTIRI